MPMRIFRWLRLDAISWSLRRLHCPARPHALVLEVGSGGNPYARANVLLDAYEVTRERHWVPLKADRPTVLGFVERLPFRDKVFDFVIASHVLEHSADPDRFLAELQRVAKAGYIETPDAFMERINPYRDHRLEVTERDNCLVIRKKGAWKADQSTVELYEHTAKTIFTKRVMPKYPFAFHIRHYWQNRIHFTVVNPEIDATWAPPQGEGQTMRVPSILGHLKGLVRESLRWLLSQRKRNRTIDLINLLRCPSCGAESVSRINETVVCSRCRHEYPIKGEIPVMYPKSNEGSR